LACEQTQKENEALREKNDRLKKTIKRLEATLEERTLEMEAARDKVYKLFMDAPAAVSIFRGPEHIFELCNSSTRETLDGRDPTGKTIKESLVEAENHGFVEIMDRVYKTGEPFIQTSVPIRLLQRDGTYKQAYFDINFHVWRDIHGKIAGLLHVATNVTEAVVAKKRLEASERRFSSMFEKSPIAICLTKLPAVTITDVNPAFESLLGFSKEEVIGKTALELGMYVESAGNPEAIIRTAPVTNQESQVRTKQGRSLIISSSIELVEIDGENYALSTLVNITERKSAEEALKQSEEQLRAIANSIPQLAWMASPDGSVSWCNQRWYDYTGTTREQMEGWGWSSVYDPRMLQKVLDAWKTALIDGNPIELETPIRGADGSFRWFLNRTIPVKDSAGRVVRWFGSGTDIEEQRRIREELRQALNSRDEFLSIASHELKTPLTPIMLQLQHLLRIAKSSPEPLVSKDRVLHVGENIDRQIKRITTLVEDLLDVAKIRSGRLSIRPAWMDLSLLVQETVERHLAELRAVGCTTSMDLRPSLSIVADRTRIEQVISNMLSNVIKYAPGSPLTIRAYSSGELARIEVEDHGAGVQEPEIIFSRFERAGVDSSKISGLGLGLYISRQILEAHHGEIFVDTAFKQGARFVVELPMNESPIQESGASTSH
jgi:PAS domain S-box-containing protein